MSSVLVLNATFEPLSVVSLHRAIVLLLKNKAEIIESAEERIRAATMSLPYPLVIRLVYYVRIPRRVGVPLTRRAIFMRDDYTCQYCGDHPAKAELTVDHVIPRVRGGGNHWENVVCACLRCNTHKGSRTPEEANMPLRTEPYKPLYCAVVLLSQATIHESWGKYIPEIGTAPAYSAG
jgi:5-methylcytosine-specific restriction endonuclease McrA